MSATPNNSKSLCAVFDPKHMWLDSHRFSKGQIAKRRALHPNQLIATKSIQEWRNGNDSESATKSISILVIPQERINKIRTARIRCCGGKIDLYLQKVVDHVDRSRYLVIQRTPPKYINKVAKRKRKNGQRTLQSSNCIEWPANGLVLAVICSIYDDGHVQTAAIEHVLTQSFGSPVNDMCLRDGVMGDLSATEFTSVPRREMKAMVTTNGCTMMTPDEIKERRKAKRRTKKQQRGANGGYVQATNERVPVSDLSHERSSSMSSSCSLCSSSSCDSPSCQFAEQLQSPLKPLFEPLHIRSGSGGKRRSTQFFGK